MENKDDQEPIEEVKLDVAKVKNLIPSYTSQKLCEMIAADRYLGISKEVAVACMEELAARRATGDVFEFEKCIEECMGKLPPLNFKTMDLRTTLQQIVKAGKK